MTEITIDLYLWTLVCVALALSLIIIALFIIRDFGKKFPDFFYVKENYNEEL